MRFCLCAGSSGSTPVGCDKRVMVVTVVTVVTLISAVLPVLSARLSHLSQGCHGGCPGAERPKIKVFHPFGTSVTGIIYLD